MDALRVTPQGSWQGPALDAGVEVSPSQETAECRVRWAQGRRSAGATSTSDLKRVSLVQFALLVEQLCCSRRNWDTK